MKDLDAITNKELALSVKRIIENAKSADSLDELKNTKKMKGLKMPTGAGSVHTELVFMWRRT